MRLMLLSVEMIWMGTDELAMPLRLLAFLRT